MGSSLNSFRDEHENNGRKTKTNFMTSVNSSVYILKISKTAEEFENFYIDEFEGNYLNQYYALINHY